MILKDYSGGKDMILLDPLYISPMLEQALLKTTTPMYDID